MNQIFVNFIFIFTFTLLLHFDDNPAAAAHSGGLWYHNKKGKFKKHIFQKAVNLNKYGHHFNFPVYPQISDMILAARHLAQVTKAMTCKVPRQRVVHISSCYPDLNGGDLYPSSTILHECSDASGCCTPSSGNGGSYGNGLTSSLVKTTSLHNGDTGDDLICAASEQEIVTLYFYLYDSGGSRHVQTLNFLNHTSCSCVARPPGYSQAVHQHELLCPLQNTLMDEAVDQPRK